MIPETLADVAATLVNAPPDGPAVYFLCTGGEVVYVGCSVKPAQRIEHHSYKKKFDFVLYLPVDAPQLIASEREWIAKLAPRHNKRGNPRESASHEAWGANGSGRQLNLRLDPETEQTIAELMPVSTEHVGLKIGPTRLIKLAIKAMHDDYVAKGYIKPIV